MRVIQQVVGDFSNINLNAKDRCSFIKDIVNALKEKQERNDSLLRPFVPMQTVPRSGFTRIREKYLFKKRYLREKCNAGYTIS